MPDTNEPSNWIQTDEVDDVAGSVRHAMRSAEWVGQDSQAWKWVILSLHSALQGACVCHLTTSAQPVGAVTKKNATEWLEYFEKSRKDSQLKPPKTYLLAFPALLKAVSRPNSAGDGSNSIGIALSNGELMDLLRFHEEFRNQFVHFEPRGWSIEVTGIPKIAKLIARMITEMVDIGYAFRHQEHSQRVDFRLNLELLANYEWPKVQR